MSMIEKCNRYAQIQTSTNLHQQIAVIGCTEGAWAVAKHMWPNDIVFCGCTKMQACIEIAVNELGTMY